MSSARFETDRELTRVRELMVAFVLDEIEDEGLKELHGLLTGPRGADFARAAWEQLDTAVDLRASLGGPAFAEAVRLRLGDDGAFARSAQRRIGTRKPLDPVVPPPPPSRPILRRVALFGIPMLIAMAITWWSMRPGPPARVEAVLGMPVASGAALRPGAALDAEAQLAVPGGAAVTLVWNDGSRAVIRGPANALAQPGALSLVSGTAWCTAGDAGMLIGLPDRRGVRLPGGSRCAISAEDNASTIAVPAGAPALAGGPAPGHAIAGGVEFAWEAPRPASGATALPGRWWDLELPAQGGDGRLLVTLEPGPAFALSAGSLLVGPGGADPLAGATEIRPPAGGRLVLSLRGLHVRIASDGVSLSELTLAAAPTALRSESRGDGGSPVLTVGPPPQPTLPLVGW